MLFEMHVQPLTVTYADSVGSGICIGIFLNYILLFDNNFKIPILFEKKEYLQDQ